MTSMYSNFGITITLKPEWYKQPRSVQYHSAYHHLQYCFGDRSLIVAEQCKKGQIHFHMYYHTEKIGKIDNKIVYDYVKGLLHKYKQDGLSVFGFIQVKELKTQKDKIQYINYMLKHPYVESMLVYKNNQPLISNLDSPDIPHSEHSLFIDEDEDDGCSTQVDEPPAQIMI